MNDPKRILVVALAFVVFALGVSGIKNHIESNGYKTQVRYTTAIQAEDENRFNYAVDSRQGNLLVNGVFSTEDKNLVKFPEMNKSFIYVERVKEHYTMHTREICSGSGKTQSCRTETYYTWDAVETEEQKSPKVSLYNREYSGDLFNFSNFLQDTSCEVITPAAEKRGFFSSKKGCEGREYYLDDNDRYVYKTVPQSLTASFLANSLQGGLMPVKENSITLEDKSIKQVLNDVGKYKLVAFWTALIMIIMLLVLASGVAYAWVFQDGRWSTDD